MKYGFTSAGLFFRSSKMTVSFEILRFLLIPLTPQLFCAGVLVLARSAAELLKEMRKRLAGNACAVIAVAQ